MTLTQEISLWEVIPSELVLLLGLALTLLVVAICFLIGYRHKTYECLTNVGVLARIAVFGVLGLVLSLFQIPMPLVTHISIHLFPAFLLAMGYGPFVGGIAGLISGSKGFLTSGDWTGPVSNAFFCIIIGTFAIYVNAEKPLRPMYLIFMNIIITTWTFGLLHMWYAYSTLVVPLLVVLNLILSMINNFIYGIIVEAIIKVKQIWEPFVEYSDLKWFQDEYEPPTPQVQNKHTSLQLISFTAIFYAWTSVIFLSPSFEFEGATFNVYNPVFFAIIVVFAILLLLSSYFVYKMERINLSGPLTLVGAILTIPIIVIGVISIPVLYTVLLMIPILVVAFTSVYIWFRYLRAPEEALA
ncbi:MAG: hypothetical protein ACXAD7_22395 [Candidatus Kariarchaeaceae archaeon]|jgi:hypothetical protein